MTSHPFKNIAIGVAFSPNLKANLHEAARLSLLFNAKLSLIHVGEESEEKRNRVEKCLLTFKNQSLDYSIDFKSGTPVDVILTHIDNKNIDLIILGALQQENILTYYLGSIARKITRAAACSILLLIKPSVERQVCQHIVVNGLKDDHTPETVQMAFFVANALQTQRLTIVEEIKESELSIKVDDDASLRKANLQREKIRRQEDARVDRILDQIPENYKSDISIEKQPIFGTRGYSIGHFAQISRADLLVMNAPGKMNFWDRLFPHDIEYILTELPTDVLIIR
ncbi:hypothetical protein JCM19298_2880 [Nonlabens ulvanivorans]|nr:universal stress protein [Nonlabens ulvanivorans]GAK92392.1 hypothetical protein JCM19298_2880 [Nonlabens ulvanivorans]